MRAGLVLGVAAVALTAAGCSLISPVAAPVVPTFPATTSAAPGPVALRTGLPTSCKDLVNGQQLDTAMGLPLSGVVRSVVGVPSPAVGMTASLSCSYGIASPSGGYAVGFALTSYRDEAAAAERVPVNVEAMRGPGEEPAPVQIGAMTATYLPLHDGPYLIASTGIYSVTVTLGPTAFTPEDAPAKAAAVAGMVLTSVRA